MTSLRSLALIAVLIYASAHADSTASISGTVKFSKRVQAVSSFGFDDAGTPIDDPVARGLRNAYVYLEPADDATRQTISQYATDEESIELPPAEIHMDQRGFRFNPQVMVVRAGQDFIFGNSDSSDHNIRGNSEIPNNIFNVIMRPGKNFTKKFLPQDPDSPVKLACDFHPSMQAWVYVLDHDRHAITDQEGAFTIKNIPPGQYTIHIIQPLTRLRTSGTIELAPSQSHTLKTTFGLKDRYYQGKPPVIIVPKR